MEKSTPRERPRRLLGATPPPAPTGRKRPSARASRSRPASPRGFASLHPSRYALTRKSSPPKGGRWPPRRATTARASNKHARYATLSHPPRPFPLGRGASRPLSSGVQAARRFACFSCPLPVSVGSFQGHQGFASPRSSPVRYSGFALRSACGFRSSPGHPFHSNSPPDPRNGPWCDSLGLGDGLG